MLTSTNEKIDCIETGLAQVRVGEVCLNEKLDLSIGTVSTPLEIEYSLFGNPELPVTVILGGISASREVAVIAGKSLESANKNTGWWEPLVGHGKAVDTTETCVISFNYVAQQLVETASGEKRSISLTPADQAIILRSLLKALGYELPITLIGSSYGGMVGLSFAELFPQAIKRLVCISASDRSTHTARAIRSIQKSIFELADDDTQKHQALSLARQLAILFYRTDEVFDSQFIDPVVQPPLGKIVDFEQTIYSYLDHQGRKFANKNNIDEYRALLDSIDKHSVNSSSIQCDSSFIAVPNDRLVSFESMRKLAHNVNGPSQFYRLESIYGHDAFLKEFKLLTELLKKILGENDEPSTSYASC